MIKMLNLFGKIKIIVWIFLLWILACTPLLDNRTIVITSLPENTEQTINLMSDIFQMAKMKALTTSSDTVFKIKSLDDICVLNMKTSLSCKNPMIYNYHFAFKPGDTYLIDQNKKHQIAALIAWPAFMKQLPDARFPVFLAYPKDGYRLGAKPLRLRWLTYDELQNLKNKKIPISIAQWAWLRREPLYKQLNLLMKQLKED